MWCEVRVLPVPASQSHRVALLSADASVLSESQSRLKTSAWWRSNRRCTFPENGSQSSTSLSSLPLARVLLLGDQARVVMGRVCCVQVAISRPVSGSQVRTVLSAEPLARVLPSGDQASRVIFC